MKLGQCWLANKSWSHPNNISKDELKDFENWIRNTDLSKLIQIIDNPRTIKFSNSDHLCQEWLARLKFENNSFRGIVEVIDYGNGCIVDVLELVHRGDIDYLKKSKEWLDRSDESSGLDAQQVWDSIKNNTTGDISTKVTPKIKNSIFNLSSWTKKLITLDSIYHGDWTPDQEMPSEDEQAATEYSKRSGNPPPIVVEKTANGFELIDGRHRSRAAHLKGKKHILAFVGSSDLSEARTKQIKVDGKEVEAVLMAGGPAFKIYSIPSGVLIDAFRKKHTFKEDHKDFKTIMKYVNLRYQPIADQDKIKQEFQDLLGGLKGKKDE